MTAIPDGIHALILKRNRLRKESNFSEADSIRKEIEKKGYEVVDKEDGSSVVYSATELGKQSGNNASLVAIFGSGEMSSVGRTIHEHLIHDLTAPVNIGLLPTPAGFEDNPYHWYEKLSSFLQKGLHNYSPDIHICRALRIDGEESTNNPDILQPLLDADYIHTGAGSPTYAARHLKDSLALTYLTRKIHDSVPVSIASAGAVAFGKVLLPVYELYMAGVALHWEEGLNFFSTWGMDVSFIPHFNNTEGGKDIDTRYCYMGEKRFLTLRTIVPVSTNFVGIDEHTALMLNLTDMEGYVLGKGAVTLLDSGTEGRKILPGEVFDLSLFNTAV